MDGKRSPRKRDARGERVHQRRVFVDVNARDAITLRECEKIAMLLGRMISCKCEKMNARAIREYAQQTGRYQTLLRL